MLKRYYSGLAAVSRLESQLERPIAHGADAQKERASTLNHTMNILSLNTPRHRHIAIVGVSGSGKTTLAQQLARRLELRHVELDSLYWDPGWAKASAPVFRQRATQAFECDSWVVDGNHPEVRDIIWGRADTVVWLDYWLGIVMWRLLRRTQHRVKTGIELWNGNHERPMSAHLFTSDSIFLWSLRTYPLRRREYTAMFSAPEYAHIKQVHLRSPRATQAWLESLPKATVAA
jgi:hypothetical protein